MKTGALQAFWPPRSSRWILLTAMDVGAYLRQWRLFPRHDHDPTGSSYGTVVFFADLTIDIGRTFSDDKT